MRVLTTYEPDRRGRAARLALVSVFAAAWMACPVIVDPPGFDGGEPPPDPCNSREDADALPECRIAPGGDGVTGHISVAGDQDWYSLELPSPLSPRSLVRVVGGYSASQTPVNLALNVLGPVQVATDGGFQEVEQSLARGVDLHGQGQPRPVDLLFRYARAGQTLYVIAADQPVVASQPGIDWRSQYQVRAELLEDPDANEPNDAPGLATPLSLSAAGAELQGTASGYLATTNDEDWFSFEIPAAVGPRRILHLSLTAPTFSPPPEYRLSYSLHAREGTAEAPVAGPALVEGRVLNEFLPAELITARLLPPGSYLMAVRGFRSPTNTAPIPGDLRPEYQLALRLLDELDPSAPQDTLATATTQALGGSPGSSGTTFDGRLEYVPDRDWFAVDVPSFAAPTRLHYRLSVGGEAGRFAPLPGFADRQLRVFTVVEGGGTAAERSLDCRTSAAACPKGYEAISAQDFQPLVNAYCDQDPALCVRSMRSQGSISGLRNFEGMLPVPPGATLRYYFLVEDLGNDWADDREYTLRVDWLPDVDEASRWAVDGEVTLQVGALAEDTVGSFPIPPAGATTLEGTVSHGYGRRLANDPTDDEGVRGLLDYDAVPTDLDRYELELPALVPDEAWDRTWELQWEVGHAPDGGKVHDLFVQVEFCDGFAADGGADCVPVPSGSGELAMAYSGSLREGWHNEGRVLSELQPMWERQIGPSSTTVTARAYGCFCFEPRFMAGGRFYVSVGAVDRERYDEVPYTLRTAYTAYPSGYAADGGTIVSCPAPVPIVSEPPDGGVEPPWVYGFEPGCRFTEQ